MGNFGAIVSAIALCVFGATETLKLNKLTPQGLREGQDTLLPMYKIPSFAQRGNESVVQPQWNESLIQPRDAEGSPMPPTNETLIQPRPVEYPQTKQGWTLNCGSYSLGLGGTAYIQSKNYPNKYPKKHLCQWSFSAPGASYIYIYCSPFDVYKANANCKGSYLKLTGGGLNKKVCGKLPHVYEISYADYLNIEFRTNKVRKTGFVCEVHAYGETTTFPPTDCPSCGTVNRASRIVGGVATDVNEYPWQVALVYASTDSVFCGGSVYNDEYIITAAHCGQAIIDYGISAEVLLGAHDINNPSNAQQRIPVAQVVNHPYYDALTYDYDIALLQLAWRASLNYRVKPACLPDPSLGYDQVNAIASGWGNTYEGGSQSSILLEVEVPTMPNSDCQQTYGSAITSNMICAGVPEGGKDTCQGDSGGPLAAEVNGQWVLVGVTSWGTGCARPNYPGVYARVTEFLGWLESTAASGQNNLCPDETISTTTTSPPSGCRCGRVNRATRIVGGVQTEVNEYPWQVALTSSSGNRPFCGGSIISDQWILTAAHCVDGASPSNARVVIGEHNWNTASETSVTERREIEQIVVHPNYNSNTQNNDMALLKLTSPIIFPSDNKIAPVCLPPPQNLYENVDAIVTGWGTLTSQGSQPYELYEVTVPTMPNSQCQSSYGTSSITSNMICAGLAAGGKDSCQGDSGGPMVTTGNTGTFMEIIGVVSWGYGCAEPNYPGVYARVNNYLDWISSNTAGSSYCPTP